MCLKFIILLITIYGSSGQRSISVSGREFRLNCEKIFLSGMNLAWHDFGWDFGNGRYDCCTRTTLETYIDRIANAGGNSIRVWLHTDGRSTPAFQGGYVTGPDATGTLISDLGRFLDKARSRHIAVIIVLWNGAKPMPSDNNLRHLFWDTAKLQSYIDKALIPMVKALACKQALAAWEIINEPEGNVYNNRYHKQPCHNTRRLAGSGAGWINKRGNGAWFPMELIQRFINWQAAAIKTADSKALVTVGSWSEKSQNSAYSKSYNYYTDECLIKAGGRFKGTLDFYQMHSYAQKGTWQTYAPFKVDGASYRLDRPLVIGEFSQCGSPASWNDIKKQFRHAYYKNYQGAWSWQANGGGYHSDSFTVQATGTNYLRNKNDAANGGRVNFVFQ